MSRSEHRPVEAIARAAADAFQEHHGSGPAGAWAAPGRVNVIGEHTDYNDGFVLPMAIDRYVVVCAAPRRDGVLRVHSVARGETLEIAERDWRQLPAASPSRTPLGWGAYPAGMAWALADAGLAVGGADLVIDNSLPAGAGMSSSAALECAVGRALLDLHGVPLSPLELARLAQRAENQFVGVPCGIMDHLAATSGRAGHVLFIDTRALSVQPYPFDLAAVGLALLIADTRVRHQLTDGGYADRRASCERAAMALGVAALRDVAIDSLDAALARLDDPVLVRRVRHVVTENRRVQQVVELCGAGRLAEIGPYLTASHASLRDDFQVSAPELDRGVETALAHGALGARMIGGGFGGSFIVLAPAAELATIEAAIAASFVQAGFRPAAFFTATATDGARRLPVPSGSATRHSIRLADGRELIYFDDVPGLDRSAPDRRPLSPPRLPSELRYDPIRNDQVIVAAHRQHRTNLPSASECPLCPSRGDRLSEIPADDYHVVVFENRFPAFGNTESSRGRCEVVCFTGAHDASFAALPPDRLSTLARAWVDRTVELSRLPGVEQVFVFENRGEAIGATLQHPHGQIYAYPFVTSYTAQALTSARRRHAEHGDCLFCAILDKERSAQIRVVAETEHFVAFVPEAPRFPYEVHLYPRRHVPDLPALTNAELDELMPLYAELVRRFDALFDRPIPYMACWHQAPVHEGRELAHLSLQLLSPQRSAHALKFFASSEAGMGAYTIDVLPEEIAARLRTAAPPTKSGDNQ